MMEAPNCNENDLEMPRLAVSRMCCTFDFRDSQSGALNLMSHTST